MSKIAGEGVMRFSENSLINSLGVNVSRAPPLGAHPSSAR